MQAPTNLKREREKRKILLWGQEWHMYAHEDGGFLNFMNFMPIVTSTLNYYSLSRKNTA